MKKLLLFLTILAVHFNSSAQNLGNFNGWTFDNWTVDQATLSLQSGAPSTTNNTPYLVISDEYLDPNNVLQTGLGYGLKNFPAGPTSTNIWNNAINQNNQCLYFDFKVIDDRRAGVSTPVHPMVRIDFGGPPHTNAPAMYIHNTTVTENDDFITVCVPLWTCDNGFPNNRNGQWFSETNPGVLSPITTSAQWDAVRLWSIGAPPSYTTIFSIIFESDFDSGVQGESIAIDNIRIDNAPAIYNSSVSINAFTHPISSQKYIYNCTYPYQITTTVSAGGSPTLDYIWYENNVEIQNSNSSTYTLNTAVPDGTIFRVDMIDNNGCIVSDNIIYGSSGLELFTSDITTCIFPATLSEDNISWSPTLYTSPAPKSYTWSTTQTTQTIDVNNHGTYTLTVTDRFGCSDTKDIIVSPSTPTIDLGQDIVTCNQNVTLQATITGNGISNYEWKENGNIIANTTASHTVTGTIASPGNDYTLTITDDNGCTASDDVNVIIDELSINFPNDITACNNNVVIDDAFCNITSTATVSSKTWYDANNNLLQTGNPLTLSAPVPNNTTYKLTVTNANGCEVSEELDVSINSLSLDLGADGNYCDMSPYTISPQITNSNNNTLSYNWQYPGGSATTPTLSVPAQALYSTQNYLLTITDSKGCQVSDGINLTHNCDECVEVSNNLPTFQKRYYQNNLELIPRSSRTYNNKVYTVSKVAQKQSIVITVHDLGGNYLFGWTYNPSQLNLEVKDIWVGDDGIFVIGNIKPNNTDAHSINSLAYQYGYLASFGLDGTFNWLKQYDDDKQSSFFNAFNPTFDEDGELEGFMITGGNRIVTAEGFQYTNPIICNLYKDGNKLFYKELDIHIPCENCLYDRESIFGYDISEIIDDNYPFYAVLLVSRAATSNGQQATGGTTAPGSARGFTYILIDQQGTIASQSYLPAFWESRGQESAPYKILAKNDPNTGHPDIFILGEYWSNSPFLFIAGDSYNYKAFSHYTNMNGMADAKINGNSIIISNDTKSVSIDLTGNVITPITYESNFISPSNSTIESNYYLSPNRSNRGHLLNIEPNGQIIKTTLLGNSIGLASTDGNFYSKCTALTENDIEQHPLPFDSNEETLNIDTPEVEIISSKLCDNDLNLITACCDNGETIEPEIGPCNHYFDFDVTINQNVITIVGPFTIESPPTQIVITQESSTGGVIIVNQTYNPSSPSYTLPAVGDYTVCITQTYGPGCTYTYCRCIHVVSVQKPSAPDDSEESEIIYKNLDIETYPTPTSNKYVINFKQNITKGLITIHATNGTTIYSQKVSDESMHIIDVSQYTPGVYIVTINLDNKIFKKKLVVIH